MKSNINEINYYESQRKSNYLTLFTFIYIYNV